MLYAWPETVLHARKTLLGKAVKIHNPMKPKTKGVLLICKFNK